MVKAVVVHVTDRTFETEVLERSRQVPVVVDFWAPWCAPCRALGPVLEKLAEEGRGRWVLAKMDTDQNPATPARYGVQGIPAVKAFVGGRLVDEFTGARPEGEVRRWLQRFLPSKADLRWAEGRQKENDGRFHEAVALFREVLKEDPRHVGARIGLARAALREGRLDEARRGIEGLDPEGNPAWTRELADLRLSLMGEGGEDLEGLEAAVRDHPDDPAPRFRLAMALAARKRYPEALGHLLHLVERHRSYQDDAARKAMLDIFEAVGSQSDLAQQWRERLAAALYR